MRKDIRDEFTALAESDMWKNYVPKEKDRIIKDALIMFTSFFWGEGGRSDVSPSPENLYKIHNYIAEYYEDFRRCKHEIELAAKIAGVRQEHIDYFKLCIEFIEKVNC